MNSKRIAPIGLTLLFALATSAGAAQAPVNAASLPPPAQVAPHSFADVVARVAPTVVSIDVEGRSRGGLARAGGEGFGPDGLERWRRLFPQLIPRVAPRPTRGTGSGFFITADGYIVTNNHLVADAEKITVRTQDDRTLPAKLVGRDADTDLAILKVEGRGFPFVSLQDRARPRVGDWVVAVGNPFNLGGTATAGIVSALSRPNVSGSSYVDYLQIDAPINRGNSGGPSFDLAGRVVGVNSAIFSPSGGSVGIGFAIPAAVAADVARQIMADGRVVRGFIGATVQDVTPEIAESLGRAADDGALVAEVVEGGPSERAGLRSGDLILRVGEDPVGSARDLTRRVAQARPGERLALQVWRAGDTRAVTLVTGERPADGRLASGEGREGPAASPGELGLAVSPAPSGGLRIERVAPGSDAARKGLRPGDVIETLSGRAATTAADVDAAVAEARTRGRTSVLARISRDGRRLFVPLTLAPQKG